MIYTPFESRSVRGLAARGIDALRGYPQTSALRALHEIMTSDEKALLHTRQALRRLLDHAASNTVAYRHIPRGARLSEYPVTDKSFIRESTDELIASDFKKRSLSEVSTGGSTGTPLVVFQDKEKQFWRSVEAIYFGEIAGYRLGMLVAYLKVWSGRNRKSRLEHFLRNTIPVDVVKLDRARTVSFLEELRRSRRSAIVSYASALDQVVRHVDTMPSDTVPTVQAIIAQSETLKEGTREGLRRHLGASTVSRYGLEEVGIVAQQPVGSLEYDINRSGAYVEILDTRSDRPAPRGGLGRIVVTDLRNLAMPIIRYDTGDMGEFATTPCGKIDRWRLRVVEGRKLDQLYDVEGNHVSSLILYKSFWKHPTIRQYQIVQVGQGEYLLRLNVTHEFVGELDLVEDCKYYLGKNATISVQYVDEVPELRSGKRRQVIQEYWA